MDKKGNNFKNSFSFVAVLFFVYILLFEFILPINGILSKPSLLLNSFSLVWRSYNLTASLSSTLLIVYVALIITYLTIYANVQFLFQWFVKYKNSFATLSVLKYIPVFFPIIIFNLWFIDKSYGEFIFAFLFCLTLSLRKLFKETEKVKEEYILVAKNLGLSPSEISEKVYWRSIQPEFIKYYGKIHILLWSILIVFEFIGNTFGIGKAFQEAYTDSNLTAIMIFGLITILFVALGNLIIESIRKVLISREA